MNKKTLIVFLFFFIYFSQIIYASEPIDISAKKIIYSDDKKFIKALGRVEIVYKNDKLFADTALIDMKEEIVHLEGEAKILWHDGQHLESKRIIYFMKTQKGYSFETRGYYAPWYYKALKGRAIGDTEILIKRGDLTTCEYDTPHYHFSAKSIKIYPNDKIVAKHVWMFIDDLPIIYLPFTLFSLREKSAFWQFNAGYSRQRGFLFENRFRLLDKKKSKLMYHHNYYSLIGTESRLTGKSEYKKFYVDGRVSWLTNSDTYDEWTQKPKSKKNDFFTKINTRWKYKEFLNLNGSLNYSSSLNYLSGVYRETTAFEVKRSEITSFINSNMRFKRLNLSLYSSKKYYWNTNKGSYAPLNYTFPRFNLYLSNVQIKRRPRLLLSFSGSYARTKNYILYAVPVNSFSTIVNLNNNQVLFRRVRINSRLSHSFSYNDQLARARSVLNLNEGISIRLGFVQERFSFYLAREIFSQKLLGKISANTITNNLGFRIWLASVNHSFSYDVLKDTFGPEIIQVRVGNKFFNFNLNANKVFGAYTLDNINSINSGLSVNLGKRGSIRNNVSIKNLGAKFLCSMNLGVSIKLTRNWYINYNTSFTTNDLGNVPFEQANRSLTIKRDLHCWEMEIYYHSFKSVYGLYDEWWLRFRLKKLNIFDVKLLSEIGY